MFELNWSSYLSFDSMFPYLIVKRFIIFSWMVTLLFAFVLTPVVVFLSYFSNQRRYFYYELYSYSYILLITDCSELVHWFQTTMYDLSMLYLIMYYLAIKIFTLSIFIISLLLPSDATPFSVHLWADLLMICSQQSL